MISRQLKKMQRLIVFLLYFFAGGLMVVSLSAATRIGAVHSERSLVDATNPEENLAFCRETSQTSTYIEGHTESYKAVDGITDSNYITNYGAETGDEFGPSWQVNLCAECCIREVTLYNRFDVHCPDQPPTYNCGGRLSGVTVHLEDQAGNVVASDQHDPNTVDLTVVPVWTTKVFNTNANRVRLTLPLSSRSLHVAEVVVSPCDGTSCSCQEPCDVLSTGNCAGFTCVGTGSSTTAPVENPTDPPVTLPTDPPVTVPTDPPVTLPTDPPVAEEPADPPVVPYFDANDSFCGDVYTAMNDCQLRNGCSTSCMESFVTDCCGFDALPDEGGFGARCLTNERHCGLVKECCPACTSYAGAVMECQVLELCSFYCGSSWSRNSAFVPTSLPVLAIFVLLVSIVLVL